MKESPLQNCPQKKEGSSAFGQWNPMIFIPYTHTIVATEVISCLNANQALHVSVLENKNVSSGPFGQ